MAVSPIAAGEKVLHHTGQHWVRYVVPCIVALLLLLVSAALIVLSGFSLTHADVASGSLFLAGAVLLLVADHWFFAYLLSESTDHLIVTSKRVIFLNTQLLIHEEMREVAFDKMKTVETEKQGLLQNILRYGTMTFEGHSPIHYVPHPNKVMRIIEQAMGHN